MYATTATTTIASFFGVPVTSLAAEIQHPEDSAAETITERKNSQDDTILPPSSFRPLAPSLPRRRTISDNDLPLHAIQRRRNVQAEVRHSAIHQQPQYLQTPVSCNESGVRFAPEVVTQLWQPEAIICSDADRANLFYSRSDIRRFRIEADAKRKQREMTDQFLANFVMPDPLVEDDLLVECLKPTRGRSLTRDLTCRRRRRADSSITRTPASRAA